MNKLEIRKKIFYLRKKNYSKELRIDYKKFKNFLKKINTRSKNIGGYFPFNYELDILNILEQLQKDKYLISLPKVGKNNMMNFYRWSINDPLRINEYGIPEPITKKKVYPDILIIPLVAFDKYLNRLGYGGGYYDRYISKDFDKKKIIKIGIGFSFQKVKKVPINRYDKKLNYIITEKNFIK